MIRFIGIFFLALATAMPSFGQVELGLLGGINYGGPIGKVDSAEGSPITRFEAGIYSQIKLAEKWFFKPSLYYTQKGAGYSQSYTRDTIVEIEIQGVKGEIPTFYQANVNGNVLAHYMELPLVVSYKNKRGFFTDFGPYISLLLASRDQGDLRLDIGEDGFITDESSFEYTDAINPIDYGVTLGGGYQFNFGLGIYIKGSRSFRKLYKTSHFENLQQTEVKLYNTLVTFGLHYALIKPKKEG